jgi:hypothetical protein
MANDHSPAHYEGATTAPAALPQSMGMMAPKTFDEAMRFADVMSKSNIVPKDYQGQPGNILVAIQWGSEIGLPPLQAMQNIAVINGRPSIWGDAMIALVRGSGKLESIEEWIEGEDKDMIAYCKVQRKGETATVREFSWDDAQTAGLIGKQGPWKQYPKRMMQLRARGFALRDVFTDVLRGIHIAEEAQDMPREMRDVTPQGEQEPEAPKKSRAASVADKVKSRKKAQEDPAPDLDAMLTAIKLAETEDDLKTAGADAAKLSDGDRDKLREAYGNRLFEIRANGKIDMIRTDLNGVSGSDVEAVMESHAKALSEIEQELPDEYKTLIDLADERANA